MWKLGVKWRCTKVIFWRDEKEGFIFFPFFELSVAGACWIENIWVLFIGFLDTLGIDQGRGAIVVTSEK